MSDPVPLSRLYQQTRTRFSDFVLGLPPASWASAVPATPGWSVRDVVAHVTGVAQDMALRKVPAAGPTPEWTAGHVERGRDSSVPELLVTWANASPGVEALLDARPIWPTVLDAGAHELDVRGAVGDTGARDSETVLVGSKVLLRGLSVDRPLLVRTEHSQARVGPPTQDGEPDQPVTLTTTAFEVVRWRLGRRSRRQLAAMDWSADPEPFLDHLCVFGPAADDVLE